MMKKILPAILFALILSGCSKYMQDTLSTQCSTSPILGNSYSRKDTLIKLIEAYTKKGIPGTAIAIYTPSEGYWGMSSGFSKIETKTPMELCNLQYLQSAAKMYMAVAILKLNEEHRINLDAPITNYLPGKYSSNIDNASLISVRNLLNHTSGINDYLDSPEYMAYVLQHPDHLFTSEELLGYIKTKKTRFTPGAKFEYSNTNFHILALIADAIAGDHNELIRDKIIKQLGLTNTYYRQIIGQPNLPNSYMDRFSTGIIENVSQLQQTSITFSKGDDGIIATPVDAVNFLRGLMEGKLLSDSSLKKMMQWVNDSEGRPTYGMGIYHVDYFGKEGYGHGGAGAGAGCGLYYFPDKQVYVFFGTNIGTLVDGPIVEKVNELKNKILEIILKG